MCWKLTIPYVSQSAAKFPLTNKMVVIISARTSLSLKVCNSTHQSFLPISISLISGSSLLLLSVFRFIRAALSRMASLVRMYEKSWFVLHNSTCDLLSWTDQSQSVCPGQEWKWVRSAFTKGGTYSSTVSFFRGFDLVSYSALLGPVLEAGWRFWQRDLISGGWHSWASRWSLSVKFSSSESLPN